MARNRSRLATEVRTQDDSRQRCDRISAIRRTEGKESKSPSLLPARMRVAFLSDAGGELRRAQGTGEVEMDNHPTALNLYLIQETKFAKRSADFGVTRRSSRFAYCITINRCCHRELVPAMPVS